MRYLDFTLSKQLKEKLHLPAINKTIMYFDEVFIIEHEYNVCPYSTVSMKIECYNPKSYSIDQVELKNILDNGIVTLKFGSPNLGFRVVLKSYEINILKGTFTFFFEVFGK